ncbi:MAG: adenylate/guanylate cyclase domain-containing protein, partial [Verrucomicrobiota bacterium]
EEMRKAGNVIIAARPGLEPAELFATNVAAVADIETTSDNDGVLRRAKPFREYKIWHPILVKASEEFTFKLEEGVFEPGKLTFTTRDGQKIPIPLDPAGNFNIVELTGNEPPPGQSPLARPFVMKTFWNLGVVLAAQTLGLDLSQARIEPRRVTLPGAKGDVVIPLDRDGTFYINWSLLWNDSRLRSVSAVATLDAGVERAKGQPRDMQLKDRLVVLGSIASGNNVSDRGPTPLAKDTFLVSKHWNVANSIITGHYVQRASPLTECFLILVMGLIALGLRYQFHPPWPSACVIGIFGAYVGVALIAYVKARYWLPIVLPGVGGLALTHVALVSYQVLFEEKEKRRVKGVFSKLVSPNVVNELLKSEHLDLGGGRRRITVFFADVRGFTQMTDDYQASAEAYIAEHKLEGEAADKYRDDQARQTLATVNIYLSTIADKVKEHDGTLDKYMGDCVMAFWGAPTPNEKHAVSCVRAAIDAQRAMYALNMQRDEENKKRAKENEERQKMGLEPLPMLRLLSLGTGINSGYAIVGLMGSAHHILNYTVFGREVNIASRLEGVSGRGRIIIGQATYADLQKHDPELAATCSPLEPVTVKGITQPVKIYEVPWKQGLEIRNETVLIRASDKATAPVVTSDTTLTAKPH